MDRADVYKKYVNNIVDTLDKKYEKKTRKIDAAFY